MKGFDFQVKNIKDGKIIASSVKKNQKSLKTTLGACDKKKMTQSMNASHER